MQIPEGYYSLLFKEKGSNTIGVRFPEHPDIITYGYILFAAFHHPRTGNPLL